MGKSAWRKRYRYPLSSFGNTCEAIILGGMPEWDKRVISDPASDFDSETGTTDRQATIWRKLSAALISPGYYTADIYSLRSQGAYGMWKLVSLAQAFWTNSPFEDFEILYNELEAWRLQVGCQSDGQEGGRGGEVDGDIALRWRVKCGRGGVSDGGRGRRASSNSQCGPVF